MILAAYRLALDATRAATEAAIRRLILAMYDRTEREASIRVLTPSLTEVVRSGRAEAYGHAVDMLRTQATAQVEAGFEPYLPAQSGYSEQSVRTVLDEDLRGSPDEAVQLIAPKLGQHVEDSARQTVVRTVDDGREPESAMEREHRAHDALSPREFEDLKEHLEDPIDRLRRQYITEGRALNWARVLSGAENCGFCVMLASRGPVYHSDEAAGLKKASDVYDTTNNAFINTYHPNCDCLVVPIYSYAEWDGWDNLRKLEDFYREAIENADWDKISAKNPNLAAVEQALRRLNKEGKSFPVPDLRGTVGVVQNAA